VFSQWVFPILQKANKKRTTKEPQEEKTNPGNTQNQTKNNIASTDLQHKHK